MNTELAALLRAAKETPEDDAPRLVIADWLDEHGEPARAELLRTQCHADYRSQAEGAALRTRADELVAANRERWWGQGDVSVYTFSHRGFLGVACSLDCLQRGPFMPALRGAWEQGWVDTLSIDLRFSGRDPWSILAESPWLDGVVQLQLRRRGIDDQAATILARSPHLATLVTLSADGIPVTPADERTLFDSPNLPRLTQLISGEDDQRLAWALYEAATTGVLHLSEIDTSRPAVPRTLDRFRGRIREVRADRVNLGLGALQRLLALPGLARLHVTHDSLGVRAAQLIAEHAPLTLAHLDLSRNRLDKSSACHLADSPRLAGLRWLDLAGNQSVFERGVLALARSPHLVGLCALDLRDTPLTADAVTTLTRPETFPRMRHIVLSAAGLTPTRRASLTARFGDALSLFLPGRFVPSLASAENAP